MNRKLLGTLGLVALIQLGLTGTLQAGIFKCVSGESEVFYLDKPCPINHEEETIEHIKDPKNSAGSSVSGATEDTVGPSFKLNKGNLANKWPVKRDADNAKNSASSLSKKDGSATEVANAASAGATQADRSKSDGIAENNLPEDFDVNNVEDMSSELVDSLSKLTVH